VQAVRSVHRLVRALFGEQVAVDCDAAGPAVLVEVGARPLEQLLLNVIFHAHDRTPTTGSIRLHVHRVEALPAVEPGQASPTRPGYVQVRVTDDGLPLSPDETAHLFDPGPNGEGRGLNVARTIVQEADGVIIATPSGDGLTVSVFLPVAEQPLQPPGIRRR
jgi:signal transduction histidine kinase